MKIAVIDDYPDAFRHVTGFARLNGHAVTVFRDTVKDADRLVERLHDFDTVVLTQQRSPFPRAVIERLPLLKFIAQTGRNTYHLDVAACTERGIVVSAAGTNAPTATAELTWGLILASLRHIPHELQQLRQGTWQTTVGTGLHGKTLGICGFGRIGNMVASVGRAFGMNVVCWGRETTLAKARASGFAAAAGREEFFERADIISLHLALNPETRGIVTAADLARMKPTALIVNTARAPLIAVGALAEALERGRPGYAAVDVYEDEPVTGGLHPLLALPNVICTPHLGYVERDTMEILYGRAIDGIVAFAAGKPVNVLNPEALAGK
jgi:D-3-phosphoglycerate dehydrogenase